MVDKIIAKYISTNRRLTIPNLGTILLSDDGLLFVEFVDSDDDTLRSLLIESGVGEFDSISMIEAFVADAQSAMNDGGVFNIGGVGALKRNDEGAISFVEESLVEEEAPVVAEPVVSAPVVEPKVVEPQPTKKTKSEKIESLYGKEQVEQSAPDPQPTQPTQPTTKSGGIDFLMLISFVAIIFALGLICYSIYIKWQIGDLVLPEAVDNILMKLFGGDMSSVDIVIE